MLKKLFLSAGLVCSSFALASGNYIEDPQLTDYRSNQGESDVWVSHKDAHAGLGDVGSSAASAFGPEGSSILRFQQAITTNDLTAEPGLSQVINDLPENTAMTYSLYYCDKKGLSSRSMLHFGVRQVVEGAPLLGRMVADKRVHIRDLDDAPQGEKSCFRQVNLEFNTGAQQRIEVFSIMSVIDPHNQDLALTEDLEVQVDEFSLTIN